MQPPVTSFLLGPNILLSNLFSNTLILGSSPNIRNQVYSHTKLQEKIILVQPDDVPCCVDRDALNIEIHSIKFEIVSV
jgi:hypothetical protein